MTTNNPLDSAANLSSTALAGRADAVPELVGRRRRAMAMGGEERVDRQHDNGKLTVRERLDLLLDAGSFLELGMLTTQQSDRTTMEGNYTAADGLIVGYGRIDGREMMIGAEDFTVMGGSEGKIGMIKRNRMLEIALARQLPVVWLLDGVGARTGESLRGSWVGGGFFLTMSRLSGRVPQIGVVLGPCAGGPALMAPLLDFVVMVEGISMLAAGGPPIVEAATGERVTKEELGGSKVHCRISGVADNEVPDEPSAFALVRRYLSFFPNNADHLPPLAAPDAVEPPPAGDILTLIPSSSKRAYDMRKVLELIVDGGSQLEVKPEFARNMLTTLARVDGHVVGILANQPLVKAGCIDAEAADKATHFIQLCDAFHIPLLFFADVPGVITGAQAERAGTLRRGLRVAWALGQCDVPMVSIVVRKSFGMGGAAMCGKDMGAVLTLAWTTAEFGTMPLQGAIRAAHRRELELGLVEMHDLEANYLTYSDLYGPAETFQIDDVIDPSETRARVARVLVAMRSGEPRVAFRHGIMP
jgi:acetyl-CoA carboxylase carboxyltransferase component